MSGLGLFGHLVVFHQLDGLQRDHCVLHYFRPVHSKVACLRRDAGMPRKL